MQLVKGQPVDVASQADELQELKISGLSTLSPFISGWNQHFPILPRPEFEPGSSTSSCVGTRVSDYVKLNVGGSLFYTTKSTLTKHDCMFRAMFSGRMEVHKDPEGMLEIQGVPRESYQLRPVSLLQAGS